MSLPDLKREALAAYAAPIETHARAWAQLVCDAVQLDVAHGETESLEVGVREVLAEAEQEWDSAAGELHVPAGAMPWARHIWCEALREALPRCLAAAQEAAKVRGLQVLRELLGRDRGGEGPDLDAMIRTARKRGA